MAELSGRRTVADRYVSTCKHCRTGIFGGATGDDAAVWSAKPLGWVHAGCHRRHGDSK